MFFRTSALRQKVKNLQGDMRLFKNENYTDFYTEPPTLGLDDVLYVEVNMERPLLTDIDSSSNVSVLFWRKTVEVVSLKVQHCRRYGKVLGYSDLGP